MHPRLRYLSLAVTTLLLAVTSPLLPLSSHLAPLRVQAQTVQDRKAEALWLDKKGLRLLDRGQFREALEKFQEALVIVREIGDRKSEGTLLSNIGLVYDNLGEYPKALEFYQQALAIAKEANNDKEQATILYKMGFVCHTLGHYAEALDFFHQALTIYRALGTHLGETQTLFRIGIVYDILGQHQKALDYHQSALKIARQIGDRWDEGKALDGIGQVYYYHLRQPLKALDYYQQSLKIFRDLAFDRGIDIRVREAYSLNNIGVVLTDLGHYPQAIEALQQSLKICREAGDRRLESFILNGIGNAYFKSGDYPKALQALQQSLILGREATNRWTEIDTLSKIGTLLEKQSQPELAIVFYKESINATEVIRQDLKKLTREEQQSYIQIVAYTYRSLADLLLKQDRVLEAQKVLDLLKVQELEDYLRNVRGNNQTATGVPNLPLEEQFNQNYNALINKAIELGKQLTQLEAIPEPNRTPQQQQRIIELRNTQQKILAEFNTFIRSPAVEQIVQQLSNTSRRQNVELEELNSLRDNLRKLEQNAVLLYPLILDDRLELVLVTADSPPIHRTASVKREDLNRAIAQFRTALENPNSDAKTPARQLYDWLIKPIENDLTQANAQTIIYAPDGQLRYIPLAALHDGNQWLVQRWRVNNITARTLTDFNTKPQPQLRVLAGAFTKGSYNFNIGNQQFSFNGLPFAGAEVENLATALPGTTKLLDTAFSREGTVPRMNDYNIVHLATHAAFVTGKPEDSFVLFGDGDRATLRDVENWSLPNVDLVVLSACETGIGGQFGNGEEILGFGYQMQRTGAKAAIASLWSVSDGGTQALMDTFYAALQTDKMTKTEALRQAQIALITGDYQTLGQQRGLTVQQRINSSLPKTVTTRLSHPNYWAPFILIGNGL